MKLTKEQLEKKVKQNRIAREQDILIYEDLENLKEETERKIRKIFDKLEADKVFKDLFYSAHGRASSDTLWQDLFDHIKKDKDFVASITGKDAVVDYEGIIKEVLSNIRQPEDGKDGKDPDYEKITKDIMAKIRMPKDGVSPDMDEVVKNATAKTIEVVTPLIPLIEDIEKDLPKLGVPIRDSLELLKGDDRLDFTAIKGIEDYKQVSAMARQPRSADIGGTFRNFYQLLDVPQSYVGQSGKFLKVKSTENGLEFGVGGGGTIDGSGTPNEIAYWVDTDTLGTLAVATYPSLTELSYVKGVTSAIQTQITAKAPSTAPTFATSITGSYLTASQILITDGSKNIISAAVATYPSLTELTYLKGVTSAIQTQIDAKGTGTVTAVSIASANGFAGSSSGGATPALTISTSITGVLKGNGTAISAATAGSDYAVGSIGLAGGQTIAGSTLTNENLTLRANAADLTTGQVNVTSTKEATNTTTASVALAGGLAVAKRVYALDMTVTNTITGSVTGNAGTATALASARTIGGVSFDGSANITVATATGGFTVSGGNLDLGTNSITLTGSIGATGARVTKGWFTDIESSNMPTVGGTAILTSLTAPQFTTIELGHATQNTLSASGGIMSIEGVAIPTISSTDALSNKTLTAPKFANAGFIADANGNELIIFTTTASAVNELTFANGATGVGPTFTASGETNVDLNFQVKGAGVYNLKATASGPTDLRLFEDTDNGTNYVSLIAPAAMASNFVLTLQGVTGTIYSSGGTDVAIADGGTGASTLAGASIVTYAGVETLTNKFITPQLQSVGDAGGTLTPVALTNDMVIATALSQATTIAAPTGSPVQGEKLTIRLKDNGTARALTWNSIYRVVGVTLPTTTVLSKTHYIGCIYNSTDSKWDVIAVGVEA